MTAHSIQLAHNFSRFPGGRYREDGPHSGQEFRETILEPALRRDEPVVVSLDGVAGLPASFLEEAFGGLIRSGFSVEDLERRLDVRAESARLRRYPGLVWEYIQTAARSGKRAAV